MAVEVRSQTELDHVTDAICGVLCGNPLEANHRCARRWMVISHPADAAEVASWEPLLNDR